MGTKCIISLGICFISCFCQVLSTFITEPCGSVQPIYGMVLKRHVFQSMKTSSSLYCSKACDNEIRCQSFNYVITKEICELNNRTREARPEDLVQDKDGLYMKRFNKRARLGSIPELPAESCKEIKASEGEVVSGNYLFVLERLRDVVQVFCDMQTEDMDECSASKPVCHVSAQCLNTLGSYKCLCQAGFTGGLTICTDIDECASGDHNCLSGTATCTNTVGSYSCSCKSGYVGDGTTSCVPTECQSYQSLTGGDRKNTHSAGPGGITCDYYVLTPGWYRFEGAAGTKMATSCVPTNHCGTHAPGWLNGAHPTVAEGQVTRQACFHYFSNCCIWAINIQVRNCSDYFVYYINRTPPEHTCHLRYCGAD